MIPIEVAAAQLARLSDLKDFPEDPILQLDLAEPLRHCDSEQHAKEVIDEWKYDNTDAPKQADLWRLVHATAPRKSAPVCPACRGDGFVQAFNRQGYPFVKPCPACRAAVAQPQKTGGGK